MVSPAIALRFRDTTPGVDTISVHKDIIQKTGFVWWGWWKKSFEDDHLEKLQKVEFPTIAFIVDRSTSRMFVAEIATWKGGLGVDDLNFVPEYYQKQSKDVFSWFKITSIDPYHFDESISSRFGDGTILFLGGEADSKILSTTKKIDRSHILHLSDLHFGPNYDFLLQGATAKIGDARRTLTECLLADLHRVEADKDIAAIIVTGDFITAGNWEDRTRRAVLAEFDALRAALGLERDQVIAVPGNHDIERYPEGSGISAADIAVQNQSNYKHEREFRTFADELVGRPWKEPLNYVQKLRLKDVDIFLCILNSCSILATEWTEYGYVGTSGLDMLSKLIREPLERPTYKVMALHHHLLPVTGVAAPNSKGVSLSLDAPALLDAAQAAGIQIALHGHEHMPRLAKYQTVPLMGQGATEPLFVVSNGSAGIADARRPGNERNTYCLFQFNKNDVSLHMREIRPDFRVGASLFSGNLRVVPAG